MASRAREAEPLAAALEALASISEALAAALTARAVAAAPCLAAVTASARCFTEFSEATPEASTVATAHSAATTSAWSSAGSCAAIHSTCPEMVDQCWKITGVAGEGREVHVPGSRGGRLAHCQVPRPPATRPPSGWDRTPRKPPESPGLEAGVSALPTGSKVVQQNLTSCSGAKSRISPARW